MHAVSLIAKAAQLWYLQHLEMGWWGDTGPSLGTHLQPGLFMLQSTAFTHDSLCAQWDGTHQALSL